MSVQTVSSLLSPGLSCSSVLVEHLDYNFIQNCSDLKYLEQILKVLRSGQEGFYPHLIEFCEKHIEKLDPKCRFLRKENPPATAACFSTEEWSEMEKELQQWEENIRINEARLNRSPIFAVVDDMPAVRCPNTVQETIRTEVKNQKSVPRPYRDWDRFDVETECAKIDESEVKSSPEVITRPDITTIKHTINHTALTDQEKVALACREKNKGNESFRSGDYEEAVVYYTRSLSLVPSAAAYNNRAQAHIKLQRWHAALVDCQTVLQLEPENVKALLRRATAHKHLGHSQESHDDLRAVLLVEPHNITAQKLLMENSKTITENQHKSKAGKKLLIQEVEEEEEEDEGGDTESGVMWDCEVTRNKHKSPKSKAAQNHSSRSEDTIQTDRRVNAPTEAPPPELTCLKEPEGHVLFKTEDAVETNTQCENTTAEFELLKMEGRDLILNGCYEAAADKYTQCLQLQPQQSVIYTNRALCYIKLQRFTEAKQDCESALQLEPTNKKAFYRRAVANKGLRDYLACSADLQQVLCLDASAVEAEELLDEVKHLIKKRKDSSSKPRRRVPITEVEDADDEDHDGADNRSWISLQPMNAFEFGQALNAARANSDLLTCAELLRNVASELLPQYISTQLDGRTISFIIQTLNVHLLRSHPHLVYQHLKHLHTAHRFSMVLMLLDSKDHRQLMEIFEKLSVVQTEAFSKNDVKDLANKYI
ncbi:sperm-associated antigen 1 [Misgurnus anguillicaudatus]|uniref:sperm-associated antigen 1 n=1 Tax=Misgurnus anguillicaudatus TaxID=75329 RepID=UPI003CCF2D9B